MNTEVLRQLKDEEDKGKKRDYNERKWTNKINKREKRERKRRPICRKKQWTRRDVEN